MPKQCNHKSKADISIQWHITTNCGNRCRHCYMFDASTYEEERDNTLSFDGLMKVLESIEDFEEKYGARVSRFVISGGDPLLRKDWEKFLKVLHDRNRIIYLMGNPETLNEKSVKKMAELGVGRFQMSLDGLEKTHDYFRSKGSFQRTVEKLDLLKQHKISSKIMFTLYPNNKDELLPLLRFVAEETSASSFSFDIGCFAGNAKGLDKNFTPSEIQKIYSQFIAEKKRLGKNNNPLRIAEKSNLLKLTRFENGEFYPAASHGEGVNSGCVAGWNGLSILSDGTALACRRMLVKVGKLPEQSFEEIFLGSKILRKLRRPEYFEGCGSCDFYKFCRGCPANVFTLTGDPFAKNPLCFRDKISRTTEASDKTASTLPMTADYADEFELIATKTGQGLRSYLSANQADENFEHLFVDLAYDRSERRQFITDPHEYVQNSTYGISDRQKECLVDSFSRFADREELPPGIRRIADAMLHRSLDKIFQL